MAVLIYTCRLFVYAGALCAFCYGQEAVTPSSCGAESSFSLETANVTNGAQLVTLFQAQPDDPDHSVPVVSVLRDTLGDDDPSNDRLENVWVYNRNPTAWWQNVAAGIPFFYGHVSSRQKVDRKPKSVLNLSAPTDRTVPRMVGMFMQSMVLDGNGL